MKLNNRYEILTPSGFQNFKGIRKLEKNRHFKILLNTGKTIKCSDSHPFILDSNQIKAYELYKGCKIDSEGDDDIFVEDIELIEDSLSLYDIVEVKNGNIFNTDGIISHNCDFISSGHTVIDGPILQWYDQTYVKDPIERRGFDGNYWIWEYPDYSKNYAVVADVARGDGSDYSAFHVIDIDNLTQVAEYRGKIGTTEYGNMLMSVATDYNNALLVIENANVGWAVIQVVIDRGYSNLYYSYRQDAYIDENVHLMKGYDLKSKSDMVPGFSTTSKTRPLTISKLETYLREKSPVVRSKRLIDELLVFIWNGSRAEAQRGYNDDLVMSFAIALWVRDTALRLKQQGLDLSRKALNHFGKTTPGVYTITPQQHAAWTLKTPGGDENLTWLI